MTSYRGMPAALVLAVVAAACGGTSSPEDAAPAPTVTVPGVEGPGPAQEGPNGFLPEPITWQDCSGAECAAVDVPLDYDAPDGPTISLFVSRVPAAQDRLGALFVNPGGPGGSATEFASILPLLLPSSIIDRFDIVGVEPRGLAGSESLDCGLDYADVYGVDPTVEDDDDRAALLASAREVADSCSAANAELLPHVGTRDVARDMDSVRAAMGDVQLSYYGASYGSVIGQVYAELFGSRVRAMVLDGIVDIGTPGLELATQQAAGFETALARFDTSCQGSADCRTRPLEAVDTVLTAAEAPGGIPAPGADRHAGPGEVSLGLASALYSQQGWPQLDAALADAVDGDGSGLVALADDYLAIGSFDVYYAVSCIDMDWPRGDPDAFLDAAKRAAAESPRFGEAIVTDYLRCVDWPAEADPLPALTAPGAPDILIVSTTGDPATPHAAGVAVADRLERGVLLVNEADGHGAVPAGSSCITAMVAAYLLDLVVPADGTTC